MEVNTTKSESTAVFVDPKTDFGFKLLFGKKENSISFLNTFLPERFVDLEYLSPEQLGDTPDDRQAMYDLYCKTNVDERIIVEMQRIFQKHFVDRMLYYASHAIRNQAPKGKLKVKDKDGKEKEIPWDYELKKVYFIAILDFTLFEEEEAKDIVVEKIDMIRRLAGLPFTDKLQLIVIELPKFTKTLAEVETEQDKWLFNLKNMGGMTERPAKMDGEFVDVYESLKISKLNSEDMGKYREVMKDERYLNLYVEGAREQFMQKGRLEGIAIGEQRGIYWGIAIGEQQGEQRGIAIGEQRGEQRERIKQVQRMAARGMSVPEIADLTDLPMEEVEEIVKNIR